MSLSENQPGARRRPRDVAAAIAAAAIAMLGTSMVLAPAASADNVDSISISAPSTADEGDTITVTVPVDSATDLYAYELTVSYDPDLLSYDADSAAFPEGGHDTAIEGTDTLTFAHTRLGTSPGLDGEQMLVTFTMTVLDGGATAITLEDASFLDSAGESTALVEPTSAEIALTAAPAPSPTTSSPSPSASTSPATSTPTPTQSASTDTAPSSDPETGSLPSTGGNVIPFLIAVPLIALGAFLIIRNKKEAVQ